MENQNTTNHLAAHLRQVYFGGNWSAVNLKEQLSDVTWQEAIAEVHEVNSILKLTYHMAYYVDVMQEVFKGNPLNAKDIWSFEHPKVEGKDDWEKVKEKVWGDAEMLAQLIETLPEEKLWAVFHDPKYGNFHRNILGVIEHLHYHLGQIVIVKKILRSIP